MWQKIKCFFKLHQPSSTVEGHSFPTKIAYTTCVYCKKKYRIKYPE